MAIAIVEPYLILAFIGLLGLAIGALFVKYVMR